MLRTGIQGCPAASYGMKCHLFCVQTNLHAGSDPAACGICLHDNAIDSRTQRKRAADEFPCLFIPLQFPAVYFCHLTGSGKAKQQQNQQKNSFC